MHPEQDRIDEREEHNLSNIRKETEQNSLYGGSEMGSTGSVLMYSDGTKNTSHGGAATTSSMQERSDARSGSSNNVKSIRIERFPADGIEFELNMDEKTEEIEISKRRRGRPKSRGKKHAKVQ